jgi:hypothetical protein
LQFGYPPAASESIVEVTNLAGIFAIPSSTHIGFIYEAAVPFLAYFLWGRLDRSFSEDFHRRMCCKKKKEKKIAFSQNTYTLNLVLTQGSPGEVCLVDAKGTPCFDYSAGNFGRVICVLTPRNSPGDVNLQASDKCLCGLTLEILYARLKNSKWNICNVHLKVTS